MRSTPMPDRPRTNHELIAGDFWQIPLSDGRFGCGRVLGLPPPGPEASVMVVVGLHDWVGGSPPTGEDLAGTRLFDIGVVHVRSLTSEGCRLIGHRDLRADGIAAITNSDPFWTSGVIYWGDGVAASRAEHRFVLGDPPPREERREVASPLTADMLEPFTSPERVVQFSRRLTDADFQTLGAWLADQPDVHLRAYASYDGSITDLEFLRFFPNVRSFSGSARYGALTSLDGLRHLRTDLQSLEIGETKPNLDLRILSRFGELRSLVIEGHTKGIETVAQLASLEELTLRSVTLPDLSVLVPLHGLRALELKLGGTKNLDLLPDMRGIEYLELWMIKGLKDLSMVSRMPSLRYLFLQSLAQVTELPSFADSVALRRVYLETMNGLRDLSPLADAPGLETLFVIAGRQFRPEHFEPFVGHPTLKSARIGTGSTKRNEAIKSLLGLEEAASARWRDVCP